MEGKEKQTGLVLFFRAVSEEPGNVEQFGQTDRNILS